MKTAEQKVVMYDSDEAAQLKTVTGWVSRDGHFYGEDEHLARLSGMTHKRCECGEVFERGYTRCRSCVAKERTTAYYALPMEEWDGVQPIALWDDDRYFFDEGAFLDFLFDLKENDTGVIPEVQAVLCTAGKLGLVDEQIWADDLPEDGDLPSQVAAKLFELNEAIKAAPTVCWWPGKVRINMEPLWAKVGGMHA